MPELRATVRMQLHADFDFFAAAEQVPYYAALGISHLYLSPITCARAGSRHGYDVIDHTRVNPELGGEAGLHTLVRTLREHAMGSVLDIVPDRTGEDPQLVSWVEERFVARKAARERRDFKAADEIRAQLAEKGIAIEDTVGGTKWKKVR